MIVLGITPLELFLMKAKYYILVLIISSIVIQSSNAFAYYDVPITSRPPESLLDNCCCKKIFENDHKTFFDCHLTSKNICPEGTERYSTAAVECPGNLVITSYSKEN